jgi:hypothetical protein
LGKNSGKNSGNLIGTLWEHVGKKPKNLTLPPPQKEKKIDPLWVHANLSHWPHEIGFWQVKCRKVERCERLTTFMPSMTGRSVVFYLFICLSWLVGVCWSVLVSFFVLFVCSGHLYWGRGWGHITESGVLQISTCPRWSHVVLIWGSPLSKGVPLPPPLPFPYVPLWFGIGPYYLCEISKLCPFMLSSSS